MDRIHLMAYDMVTTKGGDDGDPYHAGLEKVRQALAALLQPGGGLEGTPPEKILLGIPAYARHVTVPTNVKTFAEIHDGIVAESGAGIDWETLHSWQGFEWESGRRIRDKVQLARELGLGGVFFWEIGQDKATESHPRGILIETAAAAIRNETMIDSTADRSSVGAEL
jgi:GH18 family chitinase